MTDLQAKARRALASRGVKHPAPSQVVAEMKHIASQPADDLDQGHDLFSRLKKACGA